MKRRVIWILVIIFLYILIGSALPFIRQLNVSQTYKVDFDIHRFYENDGSICYAYPIRDNDEARIERIRAIDNARDKIILGSYRLRADEAGKIYIASLVEAAKRGVEIEIILDGNTLFVNAGRNNYYKALDSFDNVTFRIYNPISILKPWSIHGRMHDKYMIVDDELGFLGGRNIENRFLITNKDLSYDWDTIFYMEQRSENDGLDQLSKYFYNIFNNGENNLDLDRAAIFASDRKNQEILAELEEIYEKSKKTNPKNYEQVSYKDKLIRVEQISLISNPINIFTKQPQAFYEITELMLKAKSSVTIHTPYYIGNEKMYAKTSQIAENADTTLFTNSPANNANLVGAGDLLVHKKKFEDSGLNVLLSSKENSYHGKAFTVDDNLSGIGSFNWDMRSVYIDTELMLVIHSKDFYEAFRREMDYYEHDASRVGEDGEIFNPAGKPYVKASLAKRIVSLLIVILFYPFRFLF